MSSIRVLVNGANGKMGQETVNAIEHDPNLILVGKATRTDNLAQLIAKTQAQVVVDFTVAASAYQNALIIIQANAHPVIGTSGILPEQISQLRELCAQKKLGAIIAPNFSIAAVLMMKYAQDMARYYPQVEIIEMHHDGKADSPSGTAIRTAEMISENRSLTAPIRSQHETIPGARGAVGYGIPIHAIRLPGIVASQEIIFGGLGETFSLRHNSIERRSFMPGVCLSCKKVMGLTKLIYGLEHIL